jgi:hypothetical protein
MLFLFDSYKLGKPIPKIDFLHIMLKSAAFFVYLSNIHYVFERYCSSYHQESKVGIHVLLEAHYALLTLIFLKQLNQGLI